MKLKALLSGILTGDERDCLVQSYDVVGDIAVIIIPPELAHRETDIGNAILDTHPNINVVAKRSGKYGGRHRTIQLEIIAGENRRETVHKEYGIRFRLNLETVYFSVRSSTERKRIADLVADNETVLVMFSGVAPYPLYIEKFATPGKIIGIELNPVAHRYARDNVKLNKARRISLYCGDAAEVVLDLHDQYDRIIMPLPTGSAGFLGPALTRLRPGGSLHHYVMSRPDLIDHALANLAAECERASRSLDAYHISVCGHTGPRTYRYCIDALIS